MLYCLDAYLADPNRQSRPPVLTAQITFLAGVFKDIISRMRAAPGEEEGGGAEDWSEDGSEGARLGGGRAFEGSVMRRGAPGAGESSEAKYVPQAKLPIPCSGHWFV